MGPRQLFRWAVSIAGLGQADKASMVEVLHQDKKALQSLVC